MVTVTVLAILFAGVTGSDEAFCAAVEQDWRGRSGLRSAKGK